MDSNLRLNVHWPSVKDKDPKTPPPAPRRRSVVEFSPTSIPAPARAGGDAAPTHPADTQSGSPASPAAASSAGEAAARDKDNRGGLGDTCRAGRALRHSGTGREEYNDAAKDAYEAKVMAHCPGCGRSFKDEATLARHAKACTGKGAAGALQAAPAAEERAREAVAADRGRTGARSPAPPPAAPRTVVCYICGREFGTSSIPGRPRRAALARAGGARRTRPTGAREENPPPATARGPAGPARPFGIHEPQCAKKFVETEAQKPAHERKPLPQRPDVQEGVTRAEYNDAAKDAYEAKVMAHCPGCGRSFKDEATLARHAKACTGKGAAGALQAAPAAEERAREAVAADRGRTGARSPAPPPAAPRTVVCYICGREFGTSSIPGRPRRAALARAGGARRTRPTGAREENPPPATARGPAGPARPFGIHEPQCAKKFVETEAQKPAHERKPLPQRPDVQEGVTRAEYNDAAKDAYEAKVMAHCPGCGRSFKDEATLARHAKACTGKGAAGALQAAPAAEERAREAVAADRGRTGARSPAPPPAAPRTVVCYICGREFGTSSIPGRPRRAALARAGGARRTRPTGAREENPPPATARGPAGPARPFGIHEPQCAKKFVETEAQKPAHERKPLPQRPDVQEGVTRAEYNDAAKDAYEAKVMAHCPGCGRSFKDEATLARHAKACTGKGAAGALQAAVAADDRAGAREGQAEAAERGGGDARKPAAPRTVVCYICGREFGKSSIPGQPTTVRQEVCGDRGAEARARAEAAAAAARGAGGRHQRGPEYNDAAKDAYEAKVMAHCLGCGRSFKDRATLARHAKACTGGGARGAPPAPDEPPGARGAGADAAAPGGGGARRQAAPRTVVSRLHLWPRVRHVFHAWPASRSAPRSSWTRRRRSPRTSGSRCRSGPRCTRAPRGRTTTRQPGAPTRPTSWCTVPCAAGASRTDEATLARHAKEDYPSVPRPRLVLSLLRRPNDRWDTRGRCRVGAHSLRRPPRGSPACLDDWQSCPDGPPALKLGRKRSERQESNDAAATAVAGRPELTPGAWEHTSARSHFTATPVSAALHISHKISYGPCTPACDKRPKVWQKGAGSAGAETARARLTVGPWPQCDAASCSALGRSTVVATHPDCHQRADQLDVQGLMASWLRAATWPGHLAPAQADDWLLGHRSADGGRKMQAGSRESAGERVQVEKDRNEQQDKGGMQP
ncbi:unnamed protein product [Prorocentrum cordatum]|uniref:C2H2-type domain-containing protein n=1 Tax=Prorocentrum cordatum TaxID=2364126 RepID=A0ABN9V8X7_9DINO|nr:unnamed protein product [Polarella glacialis]